MIYQKDSHYFRIVHEWSPPNLVPNGALGDLSPNDLTKLWFFSVEMAKSM
jgi:hypothetical protein